ncbi:hypothetical protein EV363DRAFT_1396722 [Boletus edulis]|nr:hypothetical protein EV363DRAFT_1396722 [Boletus edulis]
MIASTTHFPGRRPPASALTVGFGAYLPLPSTVLSGLQDGIQTPGVSDPYPKCAGQEQGKEEVPVPKASFHEDSEERDRQMRMAMEAALSEVGEQVRRRVHNTATVTSASAVVAGQKVGAPADANRDNANRWADKANEPHSVWVRCRCGGGGGKVVGSEHGQKTIGVLARM